jgi:uncharacterized membrane protein YgdD (TMEM256/DUF423 family)
LKEYGATVACLLGFLAVAFGAFGAHALEGTLSEEAKGWYETAVSYQLWHALAMLLAARGAQGRRLARVAAAGFLVGILLFSGSLYAMALTGARWLGMVTPLGGLSFLVAWVLLGVDSLPRKGEAPARPA